MNCKRYKTWIIEAALGVSQKHNAAREAELRRHLAACAVCREEFEHERRLTAAIDHTLERSLAAEPSAGLAAQVRQKIAGDDGRSETAFWPRFRVPRWAAVAVACAVVLAAGVIWKNLRLPARGSLTSAIDVARAEKPPSLRSKRAESNGPEVDSRGPRLSDRGSLSAEKGPRPITGRLTVATPLSKKVATVRAAKGVARHTRRVRTTKPQMPEVLVPKNEMALVLELVNGTRTGRINGESLLKVPPGFKRAPDGTLVPVPIEIKPIHIAKLDVGPGSMDEP